MIITIYTVSVSFKSYSLAHYIAPIKAAPDDPPHNKPSYYIIYLAIKKPSL